MVWPAIIAAGAAVGGSLMSKNAGTSKNWQSQLRYEQFAREDSRYQRAVKDAKAAGLHPLFAMGTSPGFSGGTSFSGQTGSAAGEGVARAGEHIAEGMRQAKRQGRTVKLDALSKQLHDLRVTKMGKEIQLDDAQLMKMASERALAEQQLLYWGDGGTGMSGGGVDTKAYPYGTLQGPSLQQRPLVASARQSHPETVESVSPSGERLQLLNPDLGLDEVGQAEYLRLKAIGWTSRQLTAWAKRRRRILKERKKRVRRSDPSFYGGS